MYFSPEQREGLIVAGKFVNRPFIITLLVLGMGWYLIELRIPFCASWVPPLAGLLSAFRGK
jgi:hypothetical protein